MLKYLNKSMRILDLGCGTGLCGAWFTDYAKDLVGVDISPNMIEQVRTEHRVNAQSRVGSPRTSFAEWTAGHGWAGVKPTWLMICCLLAGQAKKKLIYSELLVQDLNEYLRTPHEATEAFDIVVSADVLQVCRAPSLCGRA